ncbi:phthalate dioxygenase reductase [Fusarium subglutinans]|uniref:Phthalate dioxygenase reductase n=1 Tax=Gibberella subglutinans TaxID=42677 RepID=A0A109QSZ1_GIBSU|nr:phthalate dioxygenase reductase [Fusarium subglutinans]AMB48902.1 phthalate dioxygenase reductase [Fusarium subglutinans]KAF5608284.1 phthalate dioxygenase reductase [Fusarium subglutinans]
MGVPSKINIPKETVSHLDTAPTPKPGVLLQVRAGKVKKGALGGEITSAIYKQRQDGPVFCSATGVLGDEHASSGHGGTERAVHQYNPDHYPDWRAENPPEPDLYDVGAYGENLVTTNMNDDNVCIGDIYELGDDVLLEVSEPRHPCFKLNSRFRWPRALKRTIRTGRAGWNMRVLKTGTICKGDTISLRERPYPEWSVLNVQRVLRARNVSLNLLAECTQLPMTDLFLDIAKERLRSAPKTYTLVDACLVAQRVRKLTFALKEHLTFVNPEFDPYAFAQIKFGGGKEFERSYSIVDGDIYRFSLGVSLDRQSRGGSAYLHNELKIGDEIEMFPGSNPAAMENDAKCEESITRVLIVGGIGITAFLPSMRDWESKGLPYHLHYAVPSLEEAAFLDQLPKDKTTFYIRSEGQRLNIRNAIPKPGHDGIYSARIFSCGPSGMMKECESIANELGYPDHMLHFEDFGNGGGGDLGESFEVEVDEPDSNRHETMTVPPNKTLLDVLNDAGFDVLYSCKSGACGACKVELSEGKVDYKSTALLDKEKGRALQACVDRGIGRLKIEID